MNVDEWLKQEFPALNLFYYQIANEKIKMWEFMPVRAPKRRNYSRKPNPAPLGRHLLPAS
jgi:hypothetical protein